MINKFINKSDILYINFNFLNKISSASDLRTHDILERVLKSNKVIWLSGFINENKNYFHSTNSNLYIIERVKLKYNIIFKYFLRFYYFFFGNKRFEHSIIVKETINTIENYTIINQPRVILISYLAHEKFIIYLKNKFPKSKIVLETLDIQFKRYSKIYKSNNYLKYIFKFYSLSQFKKDEIRALNLADKLISISTSDSSFFKSIGCDDILFIPSGFRKINTPKIKKTNNKILFVGQMSGEANIKSVQLFIKNIFPAIIKNIPNLIFYIVGSKPSKEIIKLKSSNIKVTGYVKDISKYYLSSRVLVCPFVISYGQRTRIYEALSNGIPCVVTSNAVIGMPLENSGVIINDSYDEFAKSVIEIINNYDYYRKLSKMGIKYSKKYLSMESTYDKLIKKL